MEQLNIEQVHKRLLSIATEVNDICEKHGIPMYMIYGTMLGAIRHKSFIPWDDDMDFAVPYQYYYDLIKYLRAELPINLRCLTYDMSTTYKSPWIKVEDVNTISVDPVFNLPFEKMPGLTIDIFPLVSCDKKDCIKEVKKIQYLLNFQKYVLSKSSNNHLRWKNKIKKIIRSVVPFTPKDICEKIDKIEKKITPGNYYTIPVDPTYSYHFFPKKWFEPLTKFKFDERDFYGVTDYDNYLKEIYHDYMQLPPEEKRRVHCDNVYMK